MRVVSDAGPLISLSRVGKSGLLPGLFNDVLIPRALRDEVLNVDVERVGLRRLDQADWLSVVEVENPTVVRLLRERLDI